MIKDIREDVDRFAGVSVEIMKMEQGPGQGKPIKIQIASYDRDQLAPTTKLISDYLETLDGAVDVENSLPKPSLEWRLVVDRAKAALAGADVSAVGLAVQMLTNGVKVGEYRPDRADDAVDIRVKYPEDERRLMASSKFEWQRAAEWRPSPVLLKCVRRRRSGPFKERNYNQQK